MMIRWHKLFVRQNLARFSWLASLAIFLSAGGFVSWFRWLGLPLIAGRLLSGFCWLTLESYFAFAAIYFWRQKQYIMCAIFAALFVALPACQIYLVLHYAQLPLVKPDVTKL